MSWKNSLKKLLPERSATGREIEALKSEIEEHRKKIAIIKNNNRIEKLHRKNEKLEGHKGGV